LFVHDLAAAYTKYAARLKFKSEILATSDSQVTLKITGKNVWGAFQHESGKHVVQRCPPTENKGRRHTSTISVAVLPLPPEREMDLLPESEVEVKTQRGHGKGGQHQNKTDSAVRMVHKATKLSVFINGRDQQANRREALRILTSRVRQQQQQQKEVAYHSDRKAQMGGGKRSDKRRTYNFLESRAVDHVLGKKSKQVKEIIQKGRFDLLLN